MKVTIPYQTHSKGPLDRKLLWLLTQEIRYKRRMLKWMQRQRSRISIPGKMEEIRLVALELKVLGDVCHQIQLLRHTKASAHIAAAMNRGIRRRALEDALRIVAEEPELPGEPPDKIKRLFVRPNEAVLHLRTAVVGTKKSIAKKLTKLMQEGK